MTLHLSIKIKSKIVCIRGDLLKCADSLVFLILGICSSCLGASRSLAFRRLSLVLIANPSDLLLAAPVALDSLCPPANHWSFASVLI